MNRLLAAMLGTALVWGCGPKQLSTDDLAKEKQAVESAVDNFWKANEEKNAEAVNKMVSSSSPIMFFGTDSAEVMKSADDWKKQAASDLELASTFKVGEPRNRSTEISATGDLASTLNEVPIDMTMGKQRMHVLARIALTMKKENNEWRITQGMLAFATKGQSAAELVAKMKAGKGKAKPKRR